jgi:hypothetical protein
MLTYTGYKAPCQRSLGVAATWGAILLLTLAAGCSRPSKSSTVKPASAYRVDMFTITADINGYLAANTPDDTTHEELQATVGEMAHDYTKLAAEAGPFQGKTGDDEYGDIAALAEDGVIVTGNLASALAADPAKHADAPARLAAAVEDWVAFNDELERWATEETPYEANRWWEAPAWRRAAGAADEGTTHDE